MLAGSYDIGQRPGNAGAKTDTVTWDCWRTLSSGNVHTQRGKRLGSIYSGNKKRVRRTTNIGCASEVISARTDECGKLRTARLAHNMWLKGAQRLRKRNVLQDPRIRGTEPKSYILGCKTTHA